MDTVGGKMIVDSLVLQDGKCCPIATLRYRHIEAGRSGHRLRGRPIGRVTGWMLGWASNFANRGAYGTGRGRFRLAGAQSSQN
jgi:hypothetical protein